MQLLKVGISRKKSEQQPIPILEEEILKFYSESMSEQSKVGIASAQEDTGPSTKESSGSLGKIFDLFPLKPILFQTKCREDFYGIDRDGDGPADEAEEGQIWSDVERPPPDRGNLGGDLLPLPGGTRAHGLSGGRRPVGP